MFNDVDVGTNLHLRVAGWILLSAGGPTTNASVKDPPSKREHAAVAKKNGFIMLLMVLPGWSGCGM
jgi:hypothetical protein